MTLDVTTPFKKAAKEVDTGLEPVAAELKVDVTAFWLY